MSGDVLRPMPIHVRRYRAETEKSYLDRLFDAHSLPESGRHLYIRQLRRRLPDGADLAQTLSGGITPPLKRSIDQHVQDCAQCAGSIGARWVCTRCTTGTVIPQDAHVGSFVCRRHRRWVAPDVTPADQHSIGSAVVQADRRWQQMLATGRSTVHCGIELDTLLREWAAVNDVSQNDEDRFVLRVRLWARIVQPTMLESITRPERSYRLRHEQLANLVLCTMPTGEHAALVDGLWAMLRPTALLRRDDLPNCDVHLDEPHHLIRALATERQLIGPLPPIALYFQPVTTSRASRWEDSNQKHVVYRRSPGLRWSITRGHEGIVVFVCPQGHRLSRPANNDYKSHLNAKFPCSYCSGRKPLPGYRSLADSGKRLAVHWHPTRNGTLTPGHVATHSKKEVWWRCDNGHDFASKVSIVARGDGCPVCRGLRILIGVNDLPTLAPQVAAEWHPSRNGSLTPQQVTVASQTVVWWQCKHGHEWPTRVHVRRLSGCPVCANSRVDAGINSLRTTHPALAASWHPTRNEALTSEHVSAGSGLKVWWRCGEGHDFDQVVANRVRGSGCRYCKNRACWPGFNDTLTQHPTLMTEWDWTENNGFDPRKQLPGNSSHWWRCAEGHSSFQSVPNRRHTRGCPRCPKGIRILARGRRETGDRAAAAHATRRG